MSKLKKNPSTKKQKTLQQKQLLEEARLKKSTLNTIQSQKRSARQREKESKNRLKQLAKSSSDSTKKLRKELKAKSIPKSTQQTIRYANMIADGICEVFEGYYSKTIKIADINYQSARVEEQHDIFFKYCDALNYFGSDIHVQINVVNRRLDIDDFQSQMYLKHQEDDLNKYRDEYNTMLGDKAMQGKNGFIRDKYITFSTWAKDYTTAVQVLSRIETDIINNFKSIGSDLKPLSGAERLEIFHDLFYQNKEKFTFEYDFLFWSDLRTKDFIAPTSFNFTDVSRFEFGDFKGQVLFLKDLPSDLSDKLISELSDIPANLNISLHMHNVDQDQALELVKGKIGFMEQQKYNVQQKNVKANADPNMIPIELKFSLDEGYELLDDLQKRNQRMFKVTLLIFTSAKTFEELDDNVYQIVSTARKHNCKVDYLDYLQEKALNSVLPIGVNHLEIERTLTTASTGIFTPFTGIELYQASGMYYGLNPISKNLVILNRKSLKNGSGYVLGTPGSGKSFSCKREITYVLLNTNDDVIIIDPEGEYSPLAEGFGGEVIKISPNSENFINPLDINMDYAGKDDPLKLKSDFILSVCEQILGGRYGLTPTAKTLIDRVIRLTYSDYIFKKSSKMPTLVDFFNILKVQPEQEAKQIALSLELYVTGSLNVFAHETNIDLKKRMVVFNTVELGSSLQSLGLLIVLDQIWNRITQNRQLGKSTWIYIDEIYLLFQNEYSAQFLYMLYKRARKWGGIPTGITQNVEDLLRSDIARTMLSNSEYIQMLNQATSDRSVLADLLAISPAQLSYVTNAHMGNGLVFSGKSIVPFEDEFPKNTELYKMMTTDPKERAKYDKAKEK